jgi:hypothetical protein
MGFGDGRRTAAAGKGDIYLMGYLRRHLMKGKSRNQANYSFGIAQTHDAEIGLPMLWQIRQMIQSP